MKKNKHTVGIEGASEKPIVCHCITTGGTGTIEGQDFTLNLLFRGKKNINVKFYTADFDHASDSHEELKIQAAVLDRLSRHLHKQKDHSDTLGSLNSIEIASSLIVSTDDLDCNALDFLLADVPEEHKAEAEAGARMLFDQEMLNTNMGHGGYGNPIMGALCSAYHAPQLKQIVDDIVARIKLDTGCDHYIIIFAGLTGATGLSFLPILLERLKAHKKNGDDLKVFAVLDAGSFRAHSGAYQDPRYRGERDVKGKAAGVVASLEADGLLDVLECAVAITPMSESGEPYQLCSALALEGAQHRHTSIESLIAGKVILDQICGDGEEHEYHAVANSGKKVFEIRRSPECPRRPLSLDDLGLDAAAFHSMVRMLGIGASIKSIILSLDDSAIANIPALDGALKNQSLAQVKAGLREGAHACEILLRHIHDFCLTGSDWEQPPERFHEADNYRLAETNAIDEILRGDCTGQFNVSSLTTYYEVTEKRERKITSNAAYNKSIKKCIDRTSADSVEDFFTQLFKLAR